MIKFKNMFPMAALCLAAVVTFVTGCGSTQSAKTGTLAIAAVEESQTPENLGKMDLFEDLEVEGKWENNTFNIKSITGKYTGIAYKANKTKELKVDEIVTITAAFDGRYLDYPSIESYCSEVFGMVPASKTLDFVVEEDPDATPTPTPTPEPTETPTPTPTETPTPVPGSITHISDIPNDTMNEMIGFCTNKMNETVATKFDENERLDSYNYAGSILLTPKDGSNTNRVFLVFNAVVTADGQTCSYYRLVEIDNCLPNGSGGVSVDYNTYRDDFGSLNIGNHSGYYGYLTLPEIKSVAIDSNAGAWNYDTNIGF